MNATFPATARGRLALALSFTLGFIGLNYTAYRGYFMHDDFEFLSWAPKTGLLEFLTGFFSPLYSPKNFRPPGHFYYHVMGSTFGLQFPPYIFSIHVLHLLNAWLLWRVMRRLGITGKACAAGVFFFVFHVALFEAWWKPSYIFDMLAAAFCLLALLAWLGGRWIVSLACFWVAFKSKELAVMFPAVLLCYEILLGSGRWLKLAPFFVISASFGFQALIFSPHKNDIYTFHFDLGSLGRTFSFYSKKFLFVPYSAVALAALPPLVRDRRLWFGLASACLYLAPLLFLPGRLEIVYWYLPMTGVAIALAALAEAHARLVLIFLVLWLPWDLINFTRVRRKIFAVEDTNRVYVSALANFARAQPGTRSFIYETSPLGLSDWGLHAALNCVYNRLDVKLYFADDPASWRVLDQAALLEWDAPARRLTIVDWAHADQRQSHLDMKFLTAMFQLSQGWYTIDGSYRWTAPDAEANLWRPAGAREFEINCMLPPGEIEMAGKVIVGVTLNGQALDPRELTREGPQAIRWSLPAAAAAMNRVEFHVTPPFRPPTDPRALGLYVSSFGFLPR